ncbi:hypothetical protein ACSBR1_021956 [Camellia fascicularis]
MKHMHGLDFNPLTDIAICCGQSEAFAATIPHNPTGKLETLVGACHTRDCLAITDEVCEHITYDNKTHISLASLPGMQRRTIITSSLSKTYSVTGWRIGWAVAPACIASAIRNIHTKLTDSAPAPFQEAALTALRSPLEYFESLRLLEMNFSVYEHITYDNKTHVSLASLPGMQSRTIIISSLSKTYSVTGWRIGWAVAHACITSAIRSIHTKLMDSAPAPFQEAALTALRSPLEYFESLRRDYESRRNYTIELLAGVGFQVQFKPQGSFFLFAELPENCALSDVRVFFT